MALTTYLEKAVLDWIGGAATPTRPAGIWLGMATGTPNANGASELATNTMSRVTCTFAAANSPQGSMTNLNAMTLMANSSAATVFGFNIWDAATVGANRLAYGTLTATVSFRAGSGDQIAFAVGTLKVTLT